MAEITKINLFSNFETFRKDLHSQYRKIVSIMTEIKKINMISNDEKFRKDLHITEKLCQYDRNYGIQSHISNFPIYLS